MENRVVKVRCLKSDSDLRVSRAKIYEMKLISIFDEFKIFEYIDNTDRYNRLVNLNEYIKDGIFKLVE